MPRRHRLAGLDGLRALAVVAVLVYHADPAWLPGGFLGVDVFFVVSGFLITRQLLVEYATRGTVALGAFYLRRARRLLPALGVLVAAVALAGLLIWRDRAGALREDLAATLGYATNWWFIVRHHSYFLTAGPASPVQHLWSLAVEEQFYLLWPAVLLLALRRRRRRFTAPAAVGLLALAGALASAALMGLLAWRGGVPYRTDSSRLYFGTDTHASGLLLGAALAGALGRHGRLLRRVPPWLAECVGGAALLALLGCLLRVTEYQPGLYRGGFLAVSALAALLVAACAHPGALAGTALQVRPLRWLGQRSYEIYLWHWPVYLLVGGDADAGWRVALADAPLRALLTLVLADLTHRYVTLPVWRGWVTAPPVRRWLRPATVLVAAGAAVAGLVAVRPAPPVRPGSALAAGGVLAARVPAPLPAPSGPTPAPPGVAPAPSGGAVAPDLVTVPVTAFGDSVLLGASPALRTLMPLLSVRATVGVQSGVVFGRIRGALRGLGPVVLVHTGNNGVVSGDDLGRLLGQLAGEQLVVVVNDHLPRSWQAVNNRVFAAVVPGHRNAVLVDWYTAADPHPEWFTPDRVHLQPAGAQAYAALICAQVSARLRTDATG